MTNGRHPSSWSALQPASSSQVATGGSTKTPRQDGSWLMAATAHAQGSRKGLIGAGPRRSLTTAWAAGGHQTPRAKSIDGALLAKENTERGHEDSLVVSGGSLSIRAGASFVQTSRVRPTQLDPQRSATPKASLLPKSSPMESKEAKNGGKGLEGAGESTVHASANPHSRNPGIEMYESADGGGVMVLRRSKQAKAASPNKLMLNHYNLKECCKLEDEEDLRLLNYEHNNISRISNMQGLKHLVFLDMFSNCIEKISGLEALPSLKYLLLGRNYIRRISGLDGMSQLDVLDLHDNLLDSINGVQQLTSLRVINVAGNKINSICCLTSLTSLVEINLKRNFIVSLRPEDNGNVESTSLDAEWDPPRGGDCLPCSLKYLFLSHNRLVSFDDLCPLTHLTQLQELSLEGNPLGSSLPPRSYRRAVLQLCPNTTMVLDAQLVSPGEQMCTVVAPREPAGTQPCSTTGSRYVELCNQGFWLPVTASCNPIGDKDRTGRASDANATPQWDNPTERRPLGQAKSLLQNEDAWIDPALGNPRSSWTLQDFSDPDRLASNNSRSCLRAWEDAAHEGEMAAPPYPQPKCPRPKSSTTHTNSLLSKRDSGPQLDEPIVGYPPSHRDPRATLDSFCANSPESLTSGTLSPRGDTGRAGKTALGLSDLNRDSAPLRDDLADLKSTKGKSSSRDLNNSGGRSRKGKDPQEPSQGVVELQDGNRLCLFGNVLYALGNASAALVAEVWIKYVGWEKIAKAIPRISSMTRLKKLTFEHNRLESLNQLDVLRPVNRLQHLTVEGNQVATLVLFRPYVAAKLSQVKVLNGTPITDTERTQGRKIFAPIDEALSKEGSSNIHRTLSAKSSLEKFAHHFVNQQLSNAVAVRRRVQKLDAVWDSVVLEYLLEGFHQAEEIHKEKNKSEHLQGNSARNK